MGKIGQFFLRHPFLKILSSYTLVWPAGNLCFQKFSQKEEIDWSAVARFGTVGVTCISPILYGWLKISNSVCPGTSFRPVFIKSIGEQIFYWPVAITVFFAGMNYAEGKTYEDFKAEWKQKYLKTHLIELMFLPLIMPFVKYSMPIGSHNRNSIFALVSFFWANFLSYIKSLEVIDAPPVIA